LLCQWIADALNVVTVTGSPETTTAGNILMQLQAAGEIENVDEGREILSNSYELTYITPNEKHRWDVAFQQYLTFLDRP
jgi:sugar (pentulose or hexulose) kinase